MQISANSACLVINPTTTRVGVSPTSSVSTMSGKDYALQMKEQDNVAYREKRFDDALCVGVGGCVRFEEIDFSSCNYN